MKMIAMGERGSAHVVASLQRNVCRLVPVGSTKVVIEESSKDFIAERFEQADESGATVANGVFNAPIREAPKASSPKQGLTPTKALCCRLE